MNEFRLMYVYIVFTDLQRIGPVDSCSQNKLCESNDLNPCAHAIVICISIRGNVIKIRVHPHRYC